MNKYFKAGYPFGLAGAGLCLLSFLILQFTELNAIDFTTIAACMITPVFVFLGMRNFRAQWSGGEMLFGQGMTVGFVIYGLLAVITSLGVLTFLYLMPEVFESYKLEKLSWLHSQQDFISESVGEQAYLEALGESEEMNIFDIALDIFLKIFLLELFFTIIISIILKRTKSH
ncbi:hypothetical protein GCM10007049_38760 [Echinicola pacifica]|uniref:DUF4199 domain-containing protein n=1 Tax=Echinicola pacifica TaxID=346377 RepID=A0A918QET6_9BACT|nr:DUF4199 domain-containing protein [Echinicola pacifica]GGZ41671.1 hypothetical protein GCM10007049_38760 [Echinicola pacifica]